MANSQRDLELERAWRARLRAWRLSGLSGRAFCLRAGLSEPSFYGWRREIARRDREAAASPRAVVSSVAVPRAARRTAASPMAPGFTPVRIVADERCQSEEVWALEVSWPDGLALRVRPGFDAATLTRLLVLLGRPVAAGSAAMPGAAGSAAGGATC
jgi:hypothetical protein